MLKCSALVSREGARCGKPAKWAGKASRTWAVHYTCDEHTEGMYDSELLTRNNVANLWLQVEIDYADRALTNIQSLNKRLSQCVSDIREIAPEPHVDQRPISYAITFRARMALFGIEHATSETAAILRELEDALNEHQ